MLHIHATNHLKQRCGECGVCRHRVSAQNLFPKTISVQVAICKAEPAVQITGVDVLSSCKPAKQKTCHEQSLQFQTWIQLWFGHWLKAYTLYSFRPTILSCLKRATGLMWPSAIWTKLQKYFRLHQQQTYTIFKNHTIQRNQLKKTPADSQKAGDQCLLHERNKSGSGGGGGENRFGPLLQDVEL